jgi:hypothetical protein
MATAKRPRATNGSRVFAEEQKRKITELMAEEKEEGDIPKQINLRRYCKIKQELYDALTDEERRGYEAKAAEENKARKALPKRSEIFKCVDSRLFSAKLTNHRTTETKKTWSAELLMRSAVLSGGIGASMAKPPSLFKPHSGMQTIT